MRRTPFVLSQLAVLVMVLTVSPSYGDTVTPSVGTHAFTTADALVPVLDGPTNTHQATIDTRLYVPDNATAATPQPAILMTHGFGLSKLAGEIVSSATFLARHGYVVLTYTAQGFGSSTGCVTLDPSRPVTVAFLLSDESVASLRVVVQDPATDAELYRSPTDIPIRLGL